MIVNEDKHHLFQVLKAEMPTYEIQNLKMFDFGTCPLLLNRDCREGGAGGTFVPPPTFAKIKINQTKKINKNNGVKNSLPHSKTCCGVPVKFLLPTILSLSLPTN